MLDGRGEPAPMTGFVFKRLFQAVFVVLGVLVMVFIILHLTGDPASMLLPPGASEDDLKRVRQRYGLDKPLPVQIARFFVGDLVAPGGPAGQTIEVGSYGTGTIKSRMRPIRGAVFGDFGDSLRFIGQPAMPIVLERFPLTFQLMAVAAGYSIVLSLILGTVSA